MTDNSQAKTPLGEIVRVCLVYRTPPISPHVSAAAVSTGFVQVRLTSLVYIGSASPVSLVHRQKSSVRTLVQTFPPSTSSPMMRHAAVWIFLAPRSSAEAVPVVMMLELVTPVLRAAAGFAAAAEDEWARLGSGRER